MPDKLKRSFVQSVMNSFFPPIMILLALVVGAAALWLTPKEEDPQIVVPMADVLVSAPGLSASQVENQITEPLEKLVSQIDGVEYVYSSSMEGAAQVIVRFYVGETGKTLWSSCITNSIPTKTKFLLLSLTGL